MELKDLVADYLATQNEIESLRETSLNLLKDIADLVAPVKVDDVVQITGYSHTRKKMIVKEIWAEIPSGSSPMTGVIKEEKLALVMEGTEGAPRYRRVIVRDEVYPGADVVNVLCPGNDDPTWIIQFRDGTRIITTHHVTVVENAK